MLTQMDVARLASMKALYRAWVANDIDNEDNSPLIEQVANLLVKADDPQALWEAHVEWGETVTGCICPPECRDITQTVRIQQELKRRTN